jgi:putative PIN family toxin of toxin-antitoxin system
MRVLAYPKFKLSPADREELLADYLPYCRSVRTPSRLPRLPQCRDVNDQMFIELAAVGKADFLVTGDKDLLALAPEFGRRIVKAEAFLERLAAG